ncbi:phospholipid-binding protein [filamentous cyanobacterium CCP1]|nr:phospholipid-binding protein [filamentous cyanobacterium CCP2]PSB59978.1 phospholipid-binding protein [filamentous cyanobacterium CCP1]
MGQSTFTPLFKTIPPERIGLFGEYDHKGLAKRVSIAVNQSFDPNELGNLRIKQRGAVVVLIGEIPSQRVLIKLVNVVMSVNGAIDVEINGISVAHRLRNYLENKPSREALVDLLTLINGTPD